MEGGRSPRRVSWRRPLVFQSKLLCLSLLFLSTSLLLCLHVSVSQTGCVFRLPTSPQDPRLGQPLFSYPTAYGQHKHALPSSASSPTCSSPVPFPDYLLALEEIRRLSRRNWSQPPVLRYMAGERGSFAGNFSTQERKSYFGRGDDDDGKAVLEVPCGFFREFPVRQSDRVAMEKCRGVVVVSAIFGNHDKLRQPRGVGVKTLDTVCFFVFVDDATLRDLTHHHILSHHHGNGDQEEEEEENNRGGRGGGEEVRVGSTTTTTTTTSSSKIGVWRVVRLATGRLPYGDPAMNGVIPKHLLHRLFPNAEFSIWVDAKMQLTVDPLLLVHSLLVSAGDEADMAVSRHPLNVHTVEEAMATARWSKWRDVEGLRRQMEAYCHNGLRPWSPAKLPYTTDVPDTAIIVRRHGPRSNLFSCLLFNELEAFNPRDQLPFAYVRDLMHPKINIHMFPAEVLEHIAIEYRHNLKRGLDDETKTKQLGQHEARRASPRAIAGSSCEGYLLKMWGEEASEGE